MNTNLIEEEFIGNLFYFDNESRLIFNEFFYIPKNYLECPECKSQNINQYKNVFLCFNCKYHDVPLSNKDKFNIDIENDYLIGIDNKTGKSIFFHRWLMKEEIKNFCKMNRCEEIDVEVHHVNHKRNYNYKDNLQVMSKEQHQSYHEDDRTEKAYYTWCTKVYGSDSGDYWEEFCNWKEKKEEEGDYGQESNY